MRRRIEWPKDSGRFAWYEDHEQALMRQLTKRHEDGEITKDELRNQIDTIHDLKVEFDATLSMQEDEVEHEQQSFFQTPEKARRPDSHLTGKYHGAEATTTERASGEQVELGDLGPLKPGSAGHSVLRAYATGERLTSYDASMRACNDFHARRRESTRLLTRGFLAKDGVLPNRAPGGRDHVDAYRITETGRVELGRLDEAESATS